MNNCPYCGEKVKMVAPRVYICEHKFKEFPEENVTLVFITSKQHASVHLLKELL